MLLVVVVEVADGDLGKTIREHRAALGGVGLDESGNGSPTKAAGSDELGAFGSSEGRIVSERRFEAMENQMTY